MKVLITGGAGFIGSNFVRHILVAHASWEVVNLDKLTYAGNLANLKDVEQDPRYSFIEGDIADGDIVGRLMARGVDVVVNFAAESHVDRSIEDPSPFIDTNVRGTQVLLESVRKHHVTRFVQVSTDEVYGTLGQEGKFSEDSPLAPNSPYAASKAAADLLCRSYFHTYGLPVMVTRCSNNYGPHQYPEKLIPLVVTNAMEGKPIPVYGKGLNVRDWIFVEEHCRAIDAIIAQGRPGETYNIGADCERANIEIVYAILDIMGKPRSLVQFVSDRPGHDWRYALDTIKLNREIGWQPVYSLNAHLERTVRWYMDNEEWWRPLKSVDYYEYYERTYGRRRCQKTG
ncbi:MAG: dTDP-glucose 4,6-dehydratase [Dehalococcoidia bacterium]|nr:dTDP-glucose 4,6-dehydratase [Dehalococcoidia bacterium]